MKCERCGNDVSPRSNDGVLVNAKGKLCKGGHRHLIPTFPVNSSELAEYYADIQFRVDAVRESVAEMQEQLPVENHPCYCGDVIYAHEPYCTGRPEWWHGISFCKIRDSLVGSGCDPYDLENRESIAEGDLEECQEEFAQFVRFPFTFYSDYSGGSVERSNYRSLLRDFPDVFFKVHSWHCHSGLLFPLNYNGDNREEILEIGKELISGNPIYDDDDESQLVMEEIEASWDSYLKMDVRLDLIKNSISPEAMEDMLDAIGDEQLNELFYEFTSMEDEFPYWENGTSGVYFPCYESTVKTLQKRLWGIRIEMLNDEFVEGMDKLFILCYQ